MLERIVWILAGLLILVVGFFFLAAAVVAGLIVAAIVMARLWWLRRRLEREADAQFIHTEYRVVEREALPADVAGPQNDGAAGTKSDADGDPGPRKNGLR